jgi:hypothetical protein
LRVGASGGLMALECRDASRLQVSFGVIEADTGQVLVPRLQAEESWWVGLEAVHDHVLLLHGYADRQTGQHRGLQAFDARNGSLLWEKEQVSFFGVGCGCLIAREIHNLKEPRFLALDYAQGQVLHPNLSAGEAQSEVAAAARELAEQYEVPVRHQPGTAYFNQLQDFISARRGRVPVKDIDYLETEKYILVGYYAVLTSGKMINFLALFSLDGTFLQEERLSGEVDGPGAEAFFIFRKKLFFIQDGKSLFSFVI